MKFSVKLIAATLCAAMLCVPALAAVSATGAGAYVPNPQYTVISGTVAHQHFGTTYDTCQELQSQRHIERTFPLLVQFGNLRVYPLQ